MTGVSGRSELWPELWKGVKTLHFALLSHPGTGYQYLEQGQEIVLHRSLPARRVDSRHEDSGLGMQRTATQMHRVLGVTPEVAVAAVAVAASAGRPSAAQHLALEAPMERYFGWTKTAPGPERRRG